MALKGETAAHSGDGNTQESHIEAEWEDENVS